MVINTSTLAHAVRGVHVLADRGYFNGDQVLACENPGVLPCVPKTLTSGMPSAVSSPCRTLSTMA